MGQIYRMKISPPTHKLGYAISWSWQGRCPCTPSSPEGSRSAWSWPGDKRI